MPVSFVFQHVKDPKLTSRMVIFIFRNRLSVLDWPAQSLDQNLIENLLGNVQRELDCLESSFADVIIPKI